MIVFIAVLQLSISLVSGLFVGTLVIPTHDFTDIQKQYGIYENTNYKNQQYEIDSSTLFQKLGIDRSRWFYKHYDFPGSKIIYTVSSDSAVEFSVNFSSTGKARSWAKNVEKITDKGGPSAWTCRYYKRDPLTGFEFTTNITRCPDAIPSTKLAFNIDNDLALVGNTLSVEIAYENRAEILLVNVSDKRDFKQNLQNYQTAYQALIEDRDIILISILVLPISIFAALCFFWKWYRERVPI